MSLLTDEEIGDLLDLDKEKEYPCSLGSVFTIDVGAVADASQTKTLQAVAEWLREWCPGHERAASMRRRWNCNECLVAGHIQMREGKAPWETD